MSRAVGVCAWCRHEYDVYKMPIRRLSDKEYQRVKTHGVCFVCSENFKQEALGLQEEK